MRIYIAGPMTGLPDLNFQAFQDAATALRSEGYDVVSPAELNPDKTSTWKDCMRKCIAAISTCDAVFLLTGWERSKGAMVEYHIAVALDLDRIFQE